MKLFAVLAVCAAASGCMPFVQHGPWVRAGTSGGFMASAFHTRGQGGDLPRTAGGIDGAIRGGYVPHDSTKMAFAGGVQLSIFGLLLGAGGADFPELITYLASADAYVTGPRTSRLATSLGVNASLYHVMPYVQLGDRDPGDGGWYTTQALLFVREPVFGSGFVWLPSLTHVDADARPRATHFTVAAGIGIDNREPVYMFMLGMGMEFFRANARVR